MNNCFGSSRMIVLTGNYGSGKTEIALHLAETFAEKEKTTLVDLDIVNPYFRSGEKGPRRFRAYLNPTRTGSFLTWAETIPEPRRWAGIILPL